MSKNRQVKFILEKKSETYSGPLNIYEEHFYKIINGFSTLTLLVPFSQNGQTHSNNSLAISQQIVWVCLTILWDCRLKG